MKKKLNAVELVRKIRDEMYIEWKEDPKAFKKKLMQDTSFLNKKYGGRTKKKQAA